MYATGRAAAGALQSVQLLAEAGLKHKLQVLTESTANINMHSWIGSGRVRHLDVRWLWAQEAVHVGRVALKKVGTTENVSDSTTKHRDERELDANGRAAIYQRTSTRSLGGFTVGR